MEITTEIYNSLNLLSSNSNDNIIEEYDYVEPNLRSYTGLHFVFLLCVSL